MPIRVWRRNDPAGALRYKQHSFALAAQFLPQLFKYRAGIISSVLISSPNFQVLPLSFITSP